MTGLVEIEFRGLDTLRRYVAEDPQRAQEAARRALNFAASLARREGAKKIEATVNLPPNYVGRNDKDGKLRITQFASAGDLEAVVAGADRPVSLARYATGTLARGKPVRLKVKAFGGNKTIEKKKIFPVNLRRGQTDENTNVGLAIRLKPGERIINKNRMKPFGGGLYLLYGPSVGQVFQSVALELEAPAADALEREFVRQYTLLGDQAR